MMWSSRNTLVRCPTITELMESGDWTARGQLLRTLHFQIRKQSLKLAKVRAWHIYLTLHTVCKERD